MFNNNGNPDFYRGVKDFWGYQVPMALVQQMQFEQGVNKGRMDIGGKYFKQASVGKGPAPQYSSDANRVAYLKQLSDLPMYKGSGYMNPWDNARMKAAQSAGEIAAANSQAFVKMNENLPEGTPMPEFNPNMNYRTEGRDVSGNLDQASLAASALQASREKTMKEQGQIYTSGFFGRQSIAFDQNVRNVMASHLQKLESITPTTSNLRITEKIVS